MRRRVVVTGIGVVCGAAKDAPGFAAALAAGKRYFTELVDPRLKKLKATHASVVEALAPNPSDPPSVLSLDRNVHLSLKAMREALCQAKLGGDSLGPRASVVFGTCSGGMLSIERHYQALVRGEDPLDQDLLFSKRYHTTAKVLAWAAGASGPALTVVTACAAGAGAMVQGADLIRSGIADTVVAGGSDTFALSTLAGFDALKATCSGVCAPFSETIGLNLGEGAAFLVLESLDRATRRGASVLAELLGCGLSNDAYHPTAPDPSTKGQVAAMERALRDAGAGAAHVDYVNAHGTGTRSNDPAESRSIRRLLGDRADGVPVSSTKSMIGHCLGGAGVLEAAATVLAAREGFVPPTAGFTRAREGCGLADYVGDAGRPWRGRVALSNSFGFGGNNACLLLDVSPEPDRPITDPPPTPAAVRPVITGLGLVSPLGLGLDPLVRTASSGIAPVERFAVPRHPFEAALVPTIDTRDVDRRLDMRGMDLCSRYATMATRAALAHAQIKTRPVAMAEVGMVLGLATGPSQGESDHLLAVFESDFDLERLGAFPFVVPNEVAGHAARSLMLKGHNTVLAAGQGAGLAALVSATLAVEQRHADTIIAAAADELTERSVCDGFKVGLWGPGTSVTPGEGAAAIVVEHAGAAGKRGARILAEVVGYGMATDVENPRSCTGDSLSRAIAVALERAEVDPDAIRKVACALHGGPSDPVERRILGEMLARAEVISLAGRLGFAEAALPLFNLSYLLFDSEPESLVACACMSAEGFASAVILRSINPVI